MQALDGYLSNGWFTPNDGAVLPTYARVKLVIEEIIEKPRIDESDRQARMEGLRRIEEQLELSKDEDLSNFPRQGLMKVNFDDWLD